MISQDLIDSLTLFIEKSPDPDGLFACPRTAKACYRHAMAALRHFKDQVPAGPQAPTAPIIFESPYSVGALSVVFNPDQPSYVRNAAITMALENIKRNLADHELPHDATAIQAVSLETPSASGHQFHNASTCRFVTRIDHYDLTDAAMEMQVISVSVRAITHNVATGYHSRLLPVAPTPLQALADLNRRPRSDADPTTPTNS